MILKNGQIFTALGRFMPADVEIEGGRIAKIAPAGRPHQISPNPLFHLAISRKTRYTI